MRRISVLFTVILVISMMTTLVAADTPPPADSVTGQQRTNTDEESPLHYCFRTLETRGPGRVHSDASTDVSMNDPAIRECGHLVWMLRADEYDGFFNHPFTRTEAPIGIPTCISNPINERRTESCTRGVFYECDWINGKPLCKAQLNLNSRITGINWSIHRTMPETFPPGEKPPRYMTIRHVKIEGQIPAGRNTGLGRFTEMHFVNMSGQLLTGTLPSDWGAWTKLKSLRLFDAQLTGTIPTSYGRMAALRDVDLSGNNLRGSIPAGFGGSNSHLNFLHSLDLSDNNFTGTLPSILGSYHVLENLDLSENLYSGTISATTFPVGSILKKLDLSDNAFTGAFPSALKSRLIHLKELRLGGNKFSGCLPVDWQGWTVLKDRAALQNATGGYLPNCARAEGTGHTGDR